MLTAQKSKMSPTLAYANAHIYRKQKINFFSLVNSRNNYVPRLAIRITGTTYANEQKYNKCAAKLRRH